MRRTAALLLGVLAAAASPQDRSRLYDPYARPKNGPPLTNVFHKVKPSWIWTKLRDARRHPSARMPEFVFTDEETLDVMAYLRSVADADFPRQKWPAWADRRLEDLDGKDAEEAMGLMDRGKAVWGQARCTICHQVNGPGGRLIGGFVDLRVGGIDLQIAGPKLRRDWLYAWLRDPKDHFPDTLMPKYRFADEQIRALVEFILRDEPFAPATEEKPEDPARWKALDDRDRAARGKRLIEISRCVVCHDIRGIPEVLSSPRRAESPPEGTFESLARDVRCLSCHSLEGRGGTYAPDLASAGSRLHESWIARFLERPDMIRPLSQQMPKFNLSAEEAKVAAEWLAKNHRDARIPEAIPGGPVMEEDVRRGREAFRKRGCVACHAAGEGPGGAVGPDLRSVGSRLRPGYLWFHLKNPHAVNPFSAEPDYGLSDGEARALAAYLATKK